MPRSEEAATSKADDYDIAVRQLAFELKGKVSYQDDSCRTFEEKWQKIKLPKKLTAW